MCWIISLFYGSSHVRDALLGFNTTARLSAKRTAALAAADCDVRLDNTTVGDKGVTALAGCRKLTEFSANNTQLGNAGLTALKGCDKLTAVGVANTAVTNAGLDGFDKRTALRSLDLRKTKVTAAKVDALRAALPDCGIESDPPPAK